MYWSSIMAIMYMITTSRATHRDAAYIKQLLQEIGLLVVGMPIQIFVVFSILVTTGGQHLYPAVVGIVANQFEVKTLSLYARFNEDRRVIVHGLRRLLQHMWIHWKITTMHKM